MIKKSCQIRNIISYNDEMRKSTEDKIWFLNIINQNIKGIYDYGCGDGSLLMVIHKMYPDLILIGYDVNFDMISLAQKNLPNATFITKPIHDLTAFLVNVSSVFHEIHNYSTNIKEDYNNIFGYNAPLIAIRDMFYTEKSCRMTNKKYLSTIYQNQPADKIKDFELYNGSITENKNFLHFLLKYRYIDNWEREVRENYFPFSLEEFLKKIPKNYKVIYLHHYTLPFLREQIEKDFGFILEDFTHAKILLEKV